MTPGGFRIGWDAIVLAGGESRRMGADKLGLEVGGVSMFDRVLTAVADARRTVVVGPRRPTSRTVTWCRERPVGGGPGAALRAGLARVVADLVVVLAADQPFADARVVDDLLAAAVGADGAVAVDGAHQPQWLCSAWHTEALRRCGLAPDVSLRATIGALRWQPVTVDARVALDCDTPEDLRRARELAR